MKKVIGIAVIMLLACAVMASASATNWTLAILASGTNGTDTFAGDRWNVIGAWSQYTDALNTAALTFGNKPPGAEGSAPPPTAGNWVAVRQTTSPVGTVDVRAKYSSTVAQSKTWTMNIYWYQVQSTAAGPTSITLNIKPDFDKAGAAIAGTDGNAPDTDGAAIYHYSFRLNDGTETTYLASQLPTQLQYVVDTPHELATPDQLTVRVWTTVVPEPGSLLALGSGLAGLVGFAIRRRK